ncbi:Zinc finger protein 64 [Trichinella murrelli]|uniref:Zinc finger protein 64 n=1 Tax=Trichinella murrelli TaxID=144512 RepID=A0A0V0UIB6_9BILA|nr:Zinc finger protein 64 [Trichinella murrelli]
MNSMERRPVKTAHRGVERSEVEPAPKRRATNAGILDDQQQHLDDDDDEGVVVVVVDTDAGNGDGGGGDDSTTTPDDPATLQVCKSTICSHCGTMIKNAANLEVHMRRHLQYRPYHCIHYSQKTTTTEQTCFCKMRNALMIMMISAAQRLHSLAKGYPSIAILFLRAYLKHKGYDVDDVGRHATRAHPGCQYKLNYRPVAELESSVKSMIDACKKIGGGASLNTVDMLGSSRKFSHAVQIQGPQSLAESSMFAVDHNGSGGGGGGLDVGAGSFDLCLVTDSTIADSRSSPLAMNMNSMLTAGQTESQRVFSGLLYAALASLELDSLKCGCCGDSVAHRPDSILRHLQRHVRFNRFQCSFCGTTTGSLSALEAHAKFLHADFKPQVYLNQMRHLVRREICAVVETIFLGVGQMAKLSCALCDEKLLWRWSALLGHVRQHEGNFPYHCLLCNSPFVDPLTALQHLQCVHAGRTVSASCCTNFGTEELVERGLAKCFPIFCDQTLDQLLLVDNCSAVVEDECQISAIGASPPTSANTTLNSDDASDDDRSLTSLTGGDFNYNTGLFYNSSANGERDLVAVKKETLSNAGDPTLELPSLGKKMCCLCSTYIANNPSSFENHACKHLDYKPYHCHYCTYQSYIRGKVTRHIQQVHSGLPVKIIHKPVPGIKDRIVTMKLRCFPFLAGFAGEAPSTLSGTGGGTGSGSMPPAVAAVVNALAADGSVNVAGNDHTRTKETVVCLLCSQSILCTETALTDHLPSHIANKFFHCPVCTYATNFLIRAKQHVHSAHPQSQETRIVCCPADGMRGLQDLAVKCYGPLAASLVSSDKLAVAAAVTALAQWNNNSKPFKHQMIGGTEDDDEMQSSQAAAAIVAAGFLQAAAAAAAAAAVQAKVDDMKAKCQLCSEMVPKQLANLILHSRQHLDHKPYQCAYCSWKSAEEEEVKQHITRSHRNVALKVLFHPERTMVNRIAQRCFPNLNVGDSSQLISSGNGNGNGSPTSHITSLTPVVLTPGTPNANTILRKLVCKLCNGSIADNPKSIGIHVKNHLNYKPYRCPYCRYMSCEQSKARRHVEHVHNISGDAIEVHAEDNIKEKITDMKARCFPNLGHVGLGEGNENDSQFHLIRKKCFPDMLNRNNVAECAVANKVKATNNNNNNNTSRLSNGLSLESGNSSKLALLSSGGKSDRQIRTSKLLSGVVCQICSKEVPDGSLDAHTKSHLGFKPFHCAYCNYKSSSAAKVKSHQESAHPELPPLQRCFTQLTENMNQLITDMRSVCFPQFDNNNAQTTKQSSEQLISEAEQLRLCLAGELEAISLCWGDDTSVDRTATTTAASNCKNGGASTTVEQNNNLTCQLCKTSVSGTMNSIGLHVRSHLNYEPFHCNFCEYKSCIQEHVKEHLNNIHHSSHYEMSYNAEQDVHKKIANMRRLFWQSGESLDLSGESAAQQATVQLESMESISSLMNTMLGTSDLNFTNPIADLSAVGDISAEGESYPEVECQICSERLTNDELSKTKHLTKHLGDYEFRCYYCDFSSFVQTETLKHVTASHAGSPVRVTRTSLGTAQISAAYERLGQHSADDDQLWAHVRRHKTQSHYKCPHCSFMHSHSSKAKEHVKVEHSDKVAKLSTVQMDVDDETVWRGRCFPDWNVHAGDDGELDDLDELEEVDDEEENDDENGASNATSATATKRRSATTRVLSADGPRYICQLCKSPVSMYASSLYVHVKNHMNYKPYCCGNCDYKSPVKSKVRRHIQNAHKNVSATINYFPTPGIDHEVLRWKKKCFPEVTSFATLANDKVPCFVCKTDVADTFLSKSVHAKNHLDSKPYHCGYCLYKSCLRGETRRHVVRQHLGLPVNVVFVDKEVATKEKVTRMIEQCFGSAGTSKKSATSTQKQGGNAVPKSLKSTVSCVEEKKGNGKISIGSSSSAATAAATATTSRVSKKETNKEATATTSDVRLGQPYRVWHCSYCDYMAHSKYIVKQHCVSEHPGQPVEVLDVNRMSKK